MVQPEVRVLMTADDTDLDRDLEAAETKILGMRPKFLAMAAAASIAFGAIVNGIRRMIGWLESAEDKWEEFSEGSRDHIRDFGKEVEEVKNRVVIAFGQMWDAAKRPWEAALIEALPPLEKIEAGANVATQNIKTFSGEVLKAYSKVRVPLELMAKGATFLLPPAARVVASGVGATSGASRMLRPRLQQEMELEEQRLENMREVEEHLKQVARGKELTEFFRGAAEGLGEFFSEFTRKFGNTVDYSMSEATRSMKKGFAETMAEMRSDLEKEIERAQDEADRAIEKREKARERMQKASQELLDYQTRDPGFQASMQSLTGLYSRIQTAAASRPAEDLTEKRLYERFQQAQKLHDDAKAEADRRQKEVEKMAKERERVSAKTWEDQVTKIVDAVKSLDPFARFR